ncbi:MAG: PAS domain S-box protein [Bacteroidetes bacterium]|nr:PAS domain S-box protein [Bacteroidota bacterium]
MTSNSKIMNILILEDNKTDAELTQIRLYGLIPDCKVEVASTLKQARSLLQKKPSYDIALLDINLPDGNGLDLLVEIRQLDLNIAVIILTGSGNEEVAVAALKAGADDYVVKRDDYISRLPQIIDFTLKNFKQNLRLKSETLKILYIEYHSLDIDLTIRHLKQYAPYIHLVTLPTAEAAIEQLMNNETGACPYQVILIDYRLPGMNALEFIKKIRQELKLYIPIILVTGQGNEELAIEALKLGANDYLAKNKNYYFRLPSLITNVHRHNELIKKQAALIESESKYRLLADNSGDVIFVLDMDLNYTYLSPSIKALRGYEPEEAIKQKLSDVLTPDSYKKATTVISNIILENNDKSKTPTLPKIIELEMIRKDQTTVWTEVKASLIIDDQQNKLGILGTTRDISEHRSVIDELRKHSRAVEQSPVSIIITDTTGAIEYVNPKFTEITGYTFDEVRGKTSRLLHSGHTSNEQYEELWKTINSGNEWRGEFYNKRKDGRLIWEAVSISPITNNDGKITHFLAIKEDITEKKKTLQELIKAKEKAEESDHLKTAFLANMSHEIRTPMNGILGFAELLKEPELTGEEQKYYIDIIEKSGARMLNIINDIVDISKIESGQMHISISETNVNEQMEYIYTFFKPEAEKKGIQLLIKNTLPNEMANMETDQQKLYAILSNLVKNAIKYTDKGTIELSYNLKMGDSDEPLEFVFFVKDTGIGISKDRQSAIFERFVQSDIFDTKALEGAGLGLSIAKAFVEMQGGKIWLESEEGKGSIFFFTLPCRNLSEGINQMSEFQYL